MPAMSKDFDYTGTRVILVSANDTECNYIFMIPKIKSALEGLNTFHAEHRAITLNNINSHVQNQNW